LGSGIDSALLAAERGLPFGYAHFFASSLEYAPAIVEAYRKHFRPSAALEEPKLLLAVSVICAETEQEAIDLSGSLGLARLLLARGQPQAIASVEEARNYPYSPEERAFVESFREACILTTPGAVRPALMKIAGEFGAQELAVVTVCHDFEARRASYRHVAAAFELPGPQ
jgi:alkanesulfonate monooxygenase SsuD/methylene tetrahydromethanopterin reductase-like flavin-dependent oxidoreductase (luciferase family)